MSNSLIFYKQLDPSGDVSKLDEKTKKAYEAFFKPLPLSAFKDYLKRCRLSFINPKDKNVLTGWSQDFMIDHVFYPLISETINGEVKEVKGNINETIRIIYNEEKSAKNQEQLDEEKIKQAKKKILSVISSVVSQLFSAYDEKQKDDSLKAFEAEDEFTKTLNDVNELLDAVGFKSGELVELHEVIKSKWIIYQQNLLVRLINRVINEKYFLTKHVDMIGDLLRNISSTINRLSDLISNDFVEVVSQQLETLLNNCLRLKKDIVSHAAILFVYIKIAKKKESVESVINEILSIEDTNDEKSLEKLGKVRALFTYDGKNIPFHKYNMIEYVNGFFNSSNPEIRLYCMTVMHLILENISQSVYKGEFMKNESLQCEIYDNVQRSLEYPAKKISYWIDSILTALISCSENPTKFAEKYATEALELNLSSSKRKYYLLTIILPFVSPDFYLEKDPHIIEELMIACGDFYILPAPNLLLRLLDTLYQNKCNQDLDQWRKYWENDYFTCLKTQPLQVVKGIISTVNPILAKINKNAVVYMLSTILDSASSIDDKNSLWIFVSFLKVARERSLIVDGPDGSFNLSGTKISITMDRLEKLILNKDRNIIINILEFISINPKPSEAPSELEFELLLLFLKFVEMKKVLNEMFSVICEILTFSTKISSENVATVVLDTGSSTKKVELDEDLEKQISKIDCRGHFIIDEESKQKNKFLQNMEKILQGNTLVEALEDNGAGEEGVGSENLLVVTFYLISREAGFLFQAISALVIASQEEDLDIFDKEGLESIVNQYFHTLVNIKHIGSIDRIAIGLNTMCKSMNEVKNPILPHLSHKLLEKLLDHIEQNTFRNTLRRSAGLPYAITCLLKAECAGKRTKSLPLAIKRLLDLIENSPHKQVKIHCLNIMKRIFEDSNIKLDVDKFIGQGFMTAIKGFAIEDWSIRNSSLMLFSALSLRTVGGAKNPNSQTIKSKLNLVEFFARAPQLLDFFIEEISNFVHTDKYANTQYPPLYPIALLFTRLLPYDLKNQVKKSPSASEEEDISTKQTEENADLTDQQPAGNQYIALTEVQKILPLLVECAKNKNYMGRVMVARSILPFMVFDKIPEESINLLNRIESYDMARKSHNFCHGILLQILNVLKNYYEMKKETGIHQDEVQAAQLAQTERLMAQKLQEKSYLLTKIKCPPVQYAYIDLLRAFISNLKNENLAFALEQFKEIDQFSKSYIETQVGSNSLRIQDDMGHSVLRKKLLRYTLRNRIIYESNKSVDLHLDYLLKVLKTYENNPTAYKDEDNEFLRVILKEFYIGLKEQEEVILKGSQQKINQLVELFICVLKNEHSHDYFFSQCITFIMKILFKLGLSDAIEKNHFSPFWDIIKVLEKKFNSNGLLVKQLVKFTGLLINNGSIDVKYFEYLCLTYSSSQQMDYLRIAVIISFNICMEKLVSTLQSSKNVEDFKIFLNFCFVFLRLLQDEVPEVRQKMSNFLCKKLFSNSEKKTSEDIFLFEVTIKRFFEFLCTQEVDVQNRKQLNFFLLKHLYEMEYFSIKKTNHIEQRIFAYDKSNKFIDDMRVKKYSYHYLIKNLKSQDPANPSLTLAEYENFISQSKYSFTSLTEERRNKYQNDFSYRDEYEFENKLNELLSNNIKNVLNNGEQISFNADIDPFIQYFYEL